MEPHYPFAIAHFPRIISSLTTLIRRLCRATGYLQNKITKIHTHINFMFIIWNCIKINNGTTLLNFANLSNYWHANWVLAFEKVKTHSICCKLVGEIEKQNCRLGMNDTDSIQTLCYYFVERICFPSISVYQIFHN